MQRRSGSDLIVDSRALKALPDEIYRLKLVIPDHEEYPLTD